MTAVGWWLIALWASLVAAVSVCLMKRRIMNARPKEKVPAKGSRDGIVCSEHPAPVSETTEYVCGNCLCFCKKAEWYPYLCCRCGEELKEERT